MDKPDLPPLGPSTEHYDIPYDMETTTETTEEIIFDFDSPYLPSDELAAALNVTRYDEDATTEMHYFDITITPHNKDLTFDAFPDEHEEDGRPLVNVYADHNQGNINVHV